MSSKRESLQEQLEAEEPAGSFAYESGKGRCVIRRYPGRQAHFIYLEDEGKEPQFFESHRTLKNAEAVAEWMARGL